VIDSCNGLELGHRSRVTKSDPLLALAVVVIMAKTHDHDGRHDTRMEFACRCWLSFTGHFSSETQLLAFGYGRVVVVGSDIVVRG